MLRVLLMPVKLLLTLGHGAKGVGHLIQGAKALALLAAVGVLGSVLFNHFFGTKTPENPVPDVLAREVSATCHSAVEQFPRPEIARPTLLLPLANDREAVVTDALRHELGQGFQYRVVEPGTLERTSKEIMARLGAKEHPVTTREEALELARKTEAEVVLFGEVRQLVADSGKAEVEFEVRLLEVKDGSTLFQRTVNNRPNPPPSTQIEPWEVGLVAGVVVFAVVWPVALIPLVRRVLRAENNAYTAVMVLCCAAVPLGLAGIVAFRGGLTVWNALLYGVGVVLVVLWSLTVMTWVARAEAI